LCNQSRRREFWGNALRHGPKDHADSASALRP
jgi:hypothetical protein